MDSAFNAALARCPNFGAACYAALSSWGYTFSEAMHEGMVELFYAITEGVKLDYPQQLIKNRLRWREIDRHRKELKPEQVCEFEEYMAGMEYLSDPTHSIDISVLPTKQQHVMFLIGRGYTHEEIATKLGTPLGTIKSRSSRACEKLKPCLAQTINQEDMQSWH